MTDGGGRRGVDLCWMACGLQQRSAEGIGGLSLGISVSGGNGGGQPRSAPCSGGSVSPNLPGAYGTIFRSCAIYLIKMCIELSFFRVYSKQRTFSSRHNSTIEAVVCSPFSLFSRIELSQFCAMRQIHRWDG